MLEENLAHSLRNFIAGHDIHTAAYAGFAGLNNGKLLEAAEQNMLGRKISLVCSSAVSWALIEPHIEMIVAAVDACTPGLSFELNAVPSIAGIRDRSDGNALTD